MKLGSLAARLSRPVTPRRAANSFGAAGRWKTMKRCSGAHFVVADTKTGDIYDLERQDDCLEASHHNWKWTKRP